MLSLRLLQAFPPPAERDEILADLEREYRDRRARAGLVSSASRWLWTQIVGSGPVLLRRTWWRGNSGFDSSSNSMNPGGPLMELWIVEARFALRRLRTRPTYTTPRRPHARPRRRRNGGDRRNRSTSPRQSASVSARQ